MSRKIERALLNIWAFRGSIRAGFSSNFTRARVREAVFAATSSDRFAIAKTGATTADRSRTTAGAVRALGLGFARGFAAKISANHIPIFRAKGPLKTDLKPDEANPKIRPKVRAKLARNVCRRLGDFCFAIAPDFSISARRLNRGMALAAKQGFIFRRF